MHVFNVSVRLSQLKLLEAEFLVKDAVVLAEVTQRTVE